MTEMFTSYDNLSSDYIPNNRPKPRPIRPIVNATNSLSALWPLLNAKEEIIGAEWNYGTAFELPFEVKGNIIDDDGNLLDLEEYFTGRTITVDLLDHFYNDYMSFTLNCTVEDVTEWTIILLFEFSKELSSKIERGTYHIRLSVDDQIFYSPLDSVLSCR